MEGTTEIVIAITIYLLIVFIGLRWVFKVGAKFWELRNESLEKAKKARTKEELDEAWTLLYRASKYSVNARMNVELRTVKELLIYKYEELKREQNEI